LSNLDLDALRTEDYSPPLPDADVEEMAFVDS